jgi:hypothetical protein
MLLGVRGHSAPKVVMPGLVPGIHILAVLQLSGVAAGKDVDGRDKPGHDEIESSTLSSQQKAPADAGAFDCRSMKPTSAS